MRSAVFVLAIAFALSASGQEPAAPSTGNRAMDNALRQFAPGGAKVPPVTGERQFLLLPEAAESHVCAVPLTEMEIPKDVTFTIKTVTPAAGAMKDMPAVRVPAPPCATVKR